MNVLGIDCSSKAVHATRLDDNGDIVEMKKWSSKKTDVDERLVEIVEDMAFDMLSFGGDTIAAIEKPILIQNGQATIAIAQVVGAVKTVLQLSGIKFFAVDNKTWKKEVIGDGGSKKDKILSFSQTVWGDVFTEQDYADATCIAMWGLWRFRKGNNGKRTN